MQKVSITYFKKIFDKFPNKKAPANWTGAFLFGK